MKKLLLLLLPALLLTACKDPENRNVTDAKSLVGIYNYTRVGKFKITSPQGKEQIEAINTSGTATITHGGGESSGIQMMLTNASKDTTIVNGYCNEGYIQFEAYGDHYTSGEGFSAKFSVYSEAAIFDNLSILVQESYTGNATLPTGGQRCEGHGLLSLQRQ